MDYISERGEVFVKGNVHYFCKDPCSNFRKIKTWSTDLNDIGLVETVPEP